MPNQTTSGILFDFERDVRFSPIYKKPVKRLVQFFPGCGCKPWLKTKGECCTFCQIPVSTRFAVLGEGNETNFDGCTVTATEYREMFDCSMEVANNMDTLVLFNGGSFLTGAEIPEEFRNYAYTQFGKHSTAKQMMVESRPEYINDRVLNEALDRIERKDFMVGIGLESANDHIRNKVLKKFMSRRRFEESVELMQKLGVQVFVYVFLKAPGLTERESYDDVIETMSYLHDLGVDEMALSCAFIPQGGYLEELYKKGEFRPPWLWTIFEVIKVAKAKGWPLSIGGFEDFPPPVATAHNCNDCTNLASVVLDNERSGRSSNAEHLECECKSEWASQFAK